jgi:hypothetical protein
MRTWQAEAIEHCVRRFGLATAVVFVALGVAASATLADGDTVIRGAILLVGAHAKKGQPYRPIRAAGTVSLRGTKRSRSLHVRAGAGFQFTVSPGRYELATTECGGLRANVRVAQGQTKTVNLVCRVK